MNEPSRKKTEVLATTITNQNAHLHSSQVPPFWADWVCASTKLHVYSERQVDTWQSLPELSPEIGDFMSEQREIPNVELGTPTTFSGNW